jgi:hypothetical protein
MESTRASPAVGVWWMRRLVRASRAHLKCLTALVRYTSSRAIPAASRARSEELARRADEGSAVLVFGVARAVPTMSTAARLGPSPKTVWVPTL